MGKGQVKYLMINCALVLIGSWHVDLPGLWACLTAAFWGPEGMLNLVLQAR